MNSDQPAGRIPFIHLLRGIAALMVVYCHLVGGTVQRAGTHWWPRDRLNDYVVGPLRITQDFGSLGVFVFFLISGFVIAHVAQRDSRREFLVKRLWRIYPPLIVAITMVVVLAWFEVPGAPRMPPWSDVVLGMSLFDIIVPVRKVVLAVGWTLTIEIFFYMHAWALLGLLRRRPVAGATVLATWGLVGTYAFRRLFFFTKLEWLVRIAEMLHYLPLFAIGVVAFTWYRGQLRTAALLGLAAVFHAAYVLNLYTMKPGALIPEYRYPLQAAYAVVIVLVSLLTGRHWSLGRVSRWVGDVSYSLYLIHLPLGLVVVALVRPRAGLTAAILAAVIASSAVAYLSFVLVERPSQRAARWMLGRREPAVGAVEPAA